VSLRSPAYSGIDESTALETFSLPAVPEGNFRIAVADFGRLSGYPEPLAAGCSKQRQLLFYLDTSAVVSVPSVCATPTTAGRGGAWENGSTAQILIKPMSELGQTRKCADVTAESALPQRADIASPDNQFRKVPQADVVA
jgi:hypothetical protein